MNIPRIRMGLEFVDDSGDEVCVSRIDESNGIVTLDMLDTWSRCRFGLLIRHQKRKVGSGIERYLYDRPEADHGDGAGRRLYRYHRQSIATAAGRASHIGVINAFNRRPPFVNQFDRDSATLGYDPANANILGRMVSVQAVKRWEP